MLLFSCLGQSTLHKEYYDFEKTQIKNTYIKTRSGKLEGKFMGYFPNGSISCYGTYKQNKQVGVWEYFFSNGNPKAKGYLNGTKKEGLWIYFYESGTRSQECCYTNNHRDGECIYYYENGQVKSRGNIRNEKNDGLWVYYHEDGSLKATADFVKGRGLYTELYPEGAVKAKGLIVDGASDSIWTYYYENGNIQARGLEKAGLRDGKWQFFHPGGQLSGEGNYADNVEDGEWTYYHENGAISSKGSLVAGMKHGKWNLYYETGKFMGEGNFEYGDGDYREFYDDGKLKLEGQIRNGNYVGTWKFYYPEGEIEGVCEYGPDGEGAYSGYFKDGSKKISGKLKNGQKTGVWRLYTESGSLAGLYKTYFEHEGISQQIIKTERIPDSVKLVEVSRKKPSMVLPKTKARFYKSKINELRGFILSGNPLALVYYQLPLAAEYYFNDRLGFQAMVIPVKKPFFQSHKAILDKTINHVYSKGCFFEIGQKLYLPHRSNGPTYFGQSLRYGFTQYRVNFQDETPTGPIKKQLFGLEQRFEFALTIGKRLFKDYNQNRTYTFDVYGGVGMGYRKTFFPAETEAFSEVKTQTMYVPIRAGFMFGYFF